MNNDTKMFLRTKDTIYAYLDLIRRAGRADFGVDPESIKPEQLSRLASVIGHLEQANKLLGNPPVEFPEHPEQGYYDEVTGTIIRT